MLETVVTGLLDEFPRFFKGRKMWLTFSIALVAFFLGILLVTEVICLLQIYIKLQVLR